MRTVYRELGAGQYTNSGTTVLNALHPYGMHGMNAWQRYAQHNGGENVLNLIKLMTNRTISGRVGFTVFKYSFRKLVFPEKPSSMELYITI
jgi:hypothetical protein